MALKWEGDRLNKAMEKAQIKAVNATMAAAVIRAKKNHTWQNVTGILERSITIADFARSVDRGVRGIWGSLDVVYALIHELGGQAGRGRKVTIPARPYLRPAADAEYPSLARNIKKALAT